MKITEKDIISSQYSELLDVSKLGKPIEAARLTLEQEISPCMYIRNVSVLILFTNPVIGAYSSQALKCVYSLHKKHVTLSRMREAVLGIMRQLPDRDVVEDKEVTRFVNKLKESIRGAVKEDPSMKGDVLEHSLPYYEYRRYMEADEQPMAYAWATYLGVFRYDRIKEELK